MKTFQTSARYLQGKMVVAMFVLLLSTSFHALLAQDRSPSSSKKVSVSFENKMLTPVKYYWVGLDGKRALKNKLEPGKKITWTTYVGHIWKFEHNGQYIAKFVAIDKPSQSFQLRKGVSAPTSKSVNITFVNEASVPIQLFWVDFNGKEVQYGEIQPGQSRRQQTFHAHLWNFKYQGVVIGNYSASSQSRQEYHVTAPYISNRKRGWGWLTYIPIVNTFYVATLAADSRPVTVSSYQPPKEYKTTPLIAKYKGEEKPGSTMYFGRIVKYLDADERKKYKLHVRNGKLYDANGKVFDSSIAHEDDPINRGKAIYVMDKNGVIYANNYPVIGEFHHSSFLAGKPVSAAGEIKVKNGKITSINNQSGHYKPKNYMVDQFLDELQHQGYPENELTKLYSKNKDELRR